VNCVAGQYFVPLDLECKICEPGSYTNFTGAPFPTACSECPKGKFATAAGTAFDCDLCPVGMNSIASRVQCQYCKPGEYTFDNECILCEKGKYAPSPQDENGCLECLEGYFTEGITIGSDVCSMCQPGKWSNSSSVNCTLCDVGKYSQFGAGICPDCPAGKYSRDKGQSTACNDCAGKSDKACVIL